MNGLYAGAGGRRLPASLSPGLADTFARAEYWVKAAPTGAGDGPVRIVAQAPNPRLDRVLRRLRVHSWCLLTACNPSSRRLPDWRNAARHHLLQRALTRAAWRTLPSRSTGTDWGVEPGYVVLNIDELTARGLGRRWRQHAVLHGRVGSRATLIWS